jgi:ABC-type protease/lipase transport system fused ATPase/permease subunit
MGWAKMSAPEGSMDLLVTRADFPKKTPSGRALCGVVLGQAMKRVAVFGNAGGGKSTLARQLAAITGLPLHVIDQLQFKRAKRSIHDLGIISRAS